MTEDQRAGDTSDTETQRRNSVTRPAPAPETRETETVTPARRERRALRVLRARAPDRQVTHMRRGQLSAFWEQSWFSGKANGVIGNEGYFDRSSRISKIGSLCVRYNLDVYFNEC